MANPVISSATFVHQHSNNLVSLNDSGIESTARFIREQIKSKAYSPNTWRTHPLHLLPPTPYNASHPGTKDTLDWIFFVSALNFSFWSALPEKSRYGVEWHSDGWKASGELKVWTGYWSLLAATNKALERGNPVTSPEFYSTCSEDVITSVFTPAPTSGESISLLPERIAILREVGSILCKKFKGSYVGLLDTYMKRYGSKRTALQLVQMVVDTFPSFRDQAKCHGRDVYFWKRAQILVAETWAAFHPLDTSPHPLFPNGIGDLTMFADYRVPQILHQLNIITYSPLLRSQLPGLLPNGSEEEMAIRAASILAVERVRERIEKEGVEVSSVLIDFFLWDLAKVVESGEESVEGEGLDVPIHRTRSIWY